MKAALAAGVKGDVSDSLARFPFEARRAFLNFLSNRWWDGRAIPPSNGDQFFASGWRMLRTIVFSLPIQDEKKCNVRHSDEMHKLKRDENNEKLRLWRLLRCKMMQKELECCNLSKLN